jgi:hypothetical protein
MKIFIGVDKRQPVSYTVLRYTLEKYTSKPLQIQPLNIDFMPMKRRGLTDFTYTRYLVPHLCNYEGHALFIDADMIVQGDITEIERITDPNVAVSVVKNKLRFEWPSLMYFNNAQCKLLTPEYIETGKPQTFEWAHSVGDLSTEFNHLVGYDPENPNAKVIHFTKGIPVWDETRGCEFTQEWFKEANEAVGTCSYQELMGNSVHAKFK